MLYIDRALQVKAEVCGAWAGFDVSVGEGKLNQLRTRTISVKS
jgi:hypothetical protein